MTIPTAYISCGGDEGNRTPVQKRCPTDFSECSRCFRISVSYCTTTNYTNPAQRFNLIYLSR